MSDNECFVVEYDLPTATRYKFYRSLSRYLEDRGLAKPSTRSVIVTSDPDLAYWIYQKVVDVGGKARLYQARLLREWINDRYDDSRPLEVLRTTPGIKNGEWDYEDQD